MNRKILALALCVFISACATKHPGTRATAITSDPDNKLIVSANVLKDYSDPYNIFVDVTFENESGNWLRIDEIDLDFSNKQDLAHNIIIGNDLFAWAESFEEKKKISDFNTAVAINSMILGGAILTGTSGSNDVQLAGAAVMLGGAAWDATRVYTSKMKKAERSQLVPEKHVYRPFTVPAAGLIRRWFIVNTSTSNIVKNFTMKIKTVDGKTIDYNVPIVF